MGGRSRNSRKKHCKTKPQRILIRCGFLVGAGGLREPRRKGTRVAAPSGCIVPWAARASCWPQPQQLLPVSAAGSGRRCCTGAFFPAGLFGGSMLFSSTLVVHYKVQIKQKLQRHNNAGVLGGRGWIRTSSTITIRWMRFEIVMDSCTFFKFHQKSIIGYHNYLGTKTGYKVGYFARGEYSARASETAIAAVSALPSTA